VSLGTAHRVLWLCAFVALPVPIALLGPGHVPPAQLAELGAAALAFGLVETLRGVVGLTAAIFLAQAAFWALVLWWAARAIARALGRARPAGVVVAAALVAVACAVSVYHTPYHATRAHATLLQVYR
jgi:hypothetical protein